MADFLTAPNLTGLAGITHGFFTRRGGVSNGIYDSLNCGIGSRDDPVAVKENRARAAAAIGAGAENFLTPYQIHSATAFIVEKPFVPGPQGPQADALVTRRAGFALAVSSADCVPVLFAEPEAGVVAAAHAGWRGALGGVLEATVQAMRDLGAQNIRAVIGPTISQRAYEVGWDFMDEFTAEDPDYQRFFSNGPNEKPMFDLPSFGLMRLRAAGVEAAWTRHCTYSDPERFFSYRRSTHQGEADYGRLISAIALPGQAGITLQPMATGSLGQS